MRLVLIVLSFSILQNGIAQSTFISGHILDSVRKRPISNASIDVPDHNTTEYPPALSNNSGAFSLRLPDYLRGRIIMLRATKKGYNTYIRIRTVDPDTVYWVNMLDSIDSYSRVKTTKHRDSYTALIPLKEKCFTKKDSLSCSLSIEGYENFYRPLINNSILPRSRDPKIVLSYNEILISLDKIQRAFLNINIIQLYTSLDIYNKSKQIAFAKNIANTEETKMLNELRKYNIVK